MIISFQTNWSKYETWSSREDGGVGKHALPPHIATAKVTARRQHKYHPDLSENGAVWKSDNQGFKAAAFIQTSRRGGDMERCGDAERWWNGRFHVLVWWIKIGRDTSGGRDTLGMSNPSPKPDHPALASSTKMIIPITSGCKNQWGLGQQKKLHDSPEAPLKGPTKF